MTHDATDSRPLDLSDLREAESLGRAWDSWLRDDIEPTRHQVSQALATGIAATVEDLYDRDDTPTPAGAFRLSLKRDLLHMHDALRAATLANATEPWPPPTALGDMAAANTSLPVPLAQSARPKRWRLVRRWWPAMEFAAAAILILTLLGITFGNARIAEFFRDDNQGNFASQGESGASTGVSAIEVDPNAPVTIEQGWNNVIRDDAGVGLRPEQIAVAEGYVAVVSDHYESGSIFVSVFDAATGERLWSASVNTGMYMGIQGRDSAPIITDGRLYFLNRAGFFYGFDIAAYPDDPAALIASVQFPFGATMGDLVLHDGVMYAAGGETDESDWILPSMVEVGGSLYIVGELDDSVVGFDVASNTFVSQIDGLPIDESVTLDASSGSNGLWQLDLATGTVSQAWQDPGFSLQYVSALDSGLIAVSLSTADGQPLGISFRDAKNIDTEVFRYMPLEDLWDPRAFPAGSVAVIMTSPPETSQELVAIDPLNPSAAVQLPWDYTNAPSKPDPVIGGSSSIVVSDDDILRVYDPLTGAILGQTPIGTQNGEIAALAVVDNVVYSAFEDGTVVQFTLIQSDVPVSEPLPSTIPTATLTPDPL